MTKVQLLGHMTTGSNITAVSVGIESEHPKSIE